APVVQLMASGVAVPWALEAQRLLAADWGVAADVWSVTSWNELRREALAVQASAMLDPSREPQTPFITEQLAGASGPVIATTDYSTQVPDQIRQFIPNRFATLGADDFGFSDTRAAARRHFRIDAHSMVIRALQMLAEENTLDPGLAEEAIEKYQLSDPNAGTSGSTGGDA
ncbi:transketolase-like TK C-terminal-containing protein, partial [Nesterenkonia sp. PF2B19]|uniref:transketolase-like TK C-terminal-containing protein n=2 Tax=unclassified Nesterenkonia TaxID=2629769 RepID=UPI000A21AD00